MRCMRCVKVFGLKHLVRTVCKKKWWLKEVIAQEKVLNWLVFFYFMEQDEKATPPYSPQRIAFGWAPPPPDSDSSSDAEMLAAVAAYEAERNA